ncbi:MAG: efflux RND transporter periplasmic adaptor subunit [Candidatus Abyssobacteria bacterium SURF_5]|uniref:Efflux RND transporter periplasmic adaptor subunit n=1 Tax=Abyssobacteria bacterium (strain SURF_5) TaxID=2093360 RepID=A0A3A4NBJ9_ABYX5|nr:MAG: efflux RND transporter periplasmic adaptor subunit [Candidatus Abyssubacteria bacterium SURF_5]
MNESEERKLNTPVDESRHQRLDWLRKHKELLWGGILLFGAIMFLIGYYGARSGPVPAPHVGTEAHAEEENIRYWTCSMHPHIQMPEPGKCPICFMDLVPVYESSRSSGMDGPVLALSETARELAEIETTPVEHRPLTKTVRMVGKIDYDETRLAHVSAWIGGRIDKLHVNYLGVRVNKGDPLIYLYSPELRTAQEEYMIADRRWREATEAGDEHEIESALAVKDAIKKKMELWGILPAQIERIGANGGPDDHMTIYAPSSGTVIAREAFEGKYVQPGERLFTIVDLSEVWANLDAYEIDLSSLRIGQIVEFETDVFPGETFKGKITFIQPVLNENTRSVKVRVNVANPDERLKPGMYARARLEAPVDNSGKIVKTSARQNRALTVPATAPLLTGKRAVVYVEEFVNNEPVYVGRQVELGPRAGDYYLVLAGLNEGERVVTRGNFKIDSALQIQAKPSMMKPEGGGGPAGHQHGAVVAQADTHKEHSAKPATPNPSPDAKRLPPIPEMKPVLAAYLELGSALAADNTKAAASAFDAMRKAFANVDPHSQSGEAHDRFAPIAQELQSAIPAETPKDITQQRAAFASISSPMGDYLGAFKQDLDSPLFETFCFMAFGGKGGTWYQKGRQINNPYWGETMLRCGEIKCEIN